MQKNSIEDNQEKYEDNLNYNYMVTYITCVLSIILLLTPLGIYYKYNRQPKTSNNKIIQKIPSNDSPLFINNIIHGNGNYVTIDGFYATVVDLVDKKYILSAMGLLSKLYPEIAIRIMKKELKYDRN